MGKRKKSKNIFENPNILKSWGMDLVENCGSMITQTPPNMENLDKLIKEFVHDYNEQMENANASQ